MVGKDKNGRVHEVLRTHVRKKIRIVLAGGKGLIGSNISPYLANFYECIPLGITDWNVIEESEGRKIIKDLRPDIIINLAAMTDVDGCEDDVELAEMVNVNGAECVARLCNEYGIRIIHFSTDYVFDGKKRIPYVEEDTPAPLSVYGRTKFLGEKKVLEIHPYPLIIRTQWIYGNGRENFITKILRVAEKEGRVDVVNDQFGSPTYAKDLAEPIRLLIDLKKTGIYHVVNSGICSWYDFAQEIFTRKNMCVDVVPISSTQLKRKAKRPAFSSLSTEKLKRDTGYILRSWKEALAEYLNQI
ncbi:MAG: dTDP-4-dehydrorhamnose reductase [Deltaproteobacteria bacterium]|nr:dTDP-4-dehydrorhamnose reductase [Deltaproteobacteria bacterium]